MRKDRGCWIALAAAIPLGVVLGFFFVLAPLFTDGPASLVDPERLVSFALTALLFLAAATLLAWIARGDWWALGALGSPGVAMAVWYSAREPGIGGLAAAYVALVVAALLLGRWLGLWVRRSRAGGP